MAATEIDTGVASRIGNYSDAVAFDGRCRWLVTSGTPGLDRDGQLPQEFAAQAEQAWRNVIAALNKAGMDVQDIVRTTHFLVRREDAVTYRPIRERFLAGARPASMLMFVAGLPWPNMLIEIMVEAVQPVAEGDSERVESERRRGQQEAGLRAPMSHE